MDIEKNKNIIHFLDGNSTKKEWIELQKLLQNADNKKELEEYEGIWNAAEILGSKKNIDASWKKLENNLNTNTYQKRKLSNSPFLKIAAIFIVAFGLGILFNYYTSNYKSLKTALNNTKIQIPLGSKSNITLPDGTKVWLNSGSSIQYSNDFIQNTREVFINGEAFFNVTDNKNVPFIVHTSHINIKVHGTSFNIKSYENENIIETTLIEGLIEITGKNKNSSKSIFLKPEYKASFNKESNKLEIKNIKPEMYLYTSWIDNKFVFNNESLKSLTTRLERWYDLEIEIKNNELFNLRFSGTFTNETAEQAIHALKLSSTFNYSIAKNKVIIY